jgi:hypothetical protein
MSFSCRPQQVDGHILAGQAQGDEQPAGLIRCQTIKIDLRTDSLQEGDSPPMIKRFFGGAVTRRGANGEGVPG